MSVIESLIRSRNIVRPVLALSGLVLLLVVACTPAGSITSALVRVYANDSMGTGIIIDKGGYIVSNCHLVEGTKSVSVVLQSGEQYEGSVVCRNEGKDFALISISGSGSHLSAALPGDSGAVQQGEQVSMAGYKQGNSFADIQSGTLTRIISEEGVNYLCMSVNTEGMQGSPVFNQAGAVIGIVIEDAGDATRAGLALAINEIKDSLTDAMCNDCDKLSLSGLAVESVTDTSAVITWKTGKPAGGVVEYGPAGSFSNMTDIKAGLDTSHVIVIKALKSGSEYQYRAIAIDACGNEAKSGIQTLKTAESGPQSQYLTIINVTVTEISSSGVTVKWVTNKPANSVIFFGLTETDKNNTRTNSKYVYEHSMTFEGLQPEMQYYLDVQSVTEVAEVAEVKSVLFKTESTAPTCCKLACKLPDFKYIDMDGQDFTRDDVAGQKVVMTFVKTTCSICMGQAVYMDGIYQAWPKGDITFMAVANHEKQEDIVDWIKKYGLTVPVYHDVEGDFVNYCHLRTIPSTLCINARGIICYERIGPFGSKKEFEEALKSVNWE